MRRIVEKKILYLFRLCLLASLLPLNLLAQKNTNDAFERDTLIAAAKDLMIRTRYCALITLDASGHPQARMMDAIAPGEDMVVCLGTNPISAKVSEIKKDQRVALYYQAPDASGYVVIQGKAELVTDPEKKKIYWKEAWNRFYKNKEDAFLVIKINPIRLEVVHYKKGITSKSDSWAAPFIEFE